VRRAVGGQVLGRQRRPGLRELSFLGQGETHEQSHQFAWLVVFAVPFKQPRRTVRLIAGQSGQSRQQQNFRVRGERSQRILDEHERLRRLLGERHANAFRPESPGRTLCLDLGRRRIDGD
jgi:hypothetical protein